MKRLSVFLQRATGLLSQTLGWQQGRQGSGYEKISLLNIQRPFAVDAYIIRYPIGSEIPLHVDPVDKGQHFRLNIVLRQATVGGDFYCEKTLINTRRIKFFRPDAYRHSVSKVIKGSRYILSIGWVLNG